MKVLLWDFDGTLALRVGGMWAAALHEVLEQGAPGSGVAPDQFRAYLQSSFPWHTPERPHPELRLAEQWWNALDPLFQRAFEGVGVDESSAILLAKQERRVSPDPVRWRLYVDVLPALAMLSADGWTHVELSNHVPELRLINRHLGLGPAVSRVFAPAETGYEKPHPQAFRSVQEAAVGGAPAWMSGDRYPTDVEGAAPVGVPGNSVRGLDERARYCCEGLAGGRIIRGAGL
jgi:putative hydrolase of the HAD superfamily